MSNKNNPMEVTRILRTDAVSIHHYVYHPQTCYPRHIHYAEEQVIYCLSGSCIHTIDGAEHHLSAGEWVYIPPGAWHESRYPDPQLPERELVVSHMVNLIHPSAHDNRQTTDLQLSPQDFATAVAYCVRHHYEELIVPFAIFDEYGKPLYQADRFSDYADCCRECRSMYTGQPCLSENWDYLCDRTVRADMKCFDCPFGVNIYHKNIMFRDRVVGAVRAQRIPFGMQGSGREEPSIDAPVNTEIAFERIISQIADNLENYCYFDATRKTMLSNQQSIASFSDAQQKLLGQIQQSQDTILRLKINNHFLFNAFNSMAALALDAGNERLYGAILALADILRSNSKSPDMLISLRDELQTVRNYILIQKLRYGDRVSYTESFSDSGFMDIRIPPNTLQTIVENAFTHGFQRDIDNLEVEISILERNGLVTIKVFNTGKELSPADINRIRSGVSNNNGHGLSMVYAALERHFPRFIFDIGVREGRTVVTISVPYCDEKEGVME